ncbi:MAG: acyl-CoA dehydratase activase [Candidatus Ornithospirochaeta sp.]|nr:acyl-CoA dehydratase activase [Candidatus Ornithospirochaeta sp.]
MLRIGIDVGSTTMKTTALDEQNNLVYSDYQRHYSQIIEKGKEMLSRMMESIGDGLVTISLSGSAGMGLAEAAGIPFVQEVYATRIAAKTFIPDTDTIIELGGEDAKILFLKNGLEVRMNGSCAGGTGAFIDQMATLLGISRDDIDRLSEKSTQIYTIASRCGVFAKSDIQPLINQGAKTEDIASSILVAVVNQTIAGLAQGRKIEGRIVYLGGPLTFIHRLRHFFDQALGTEGICPENSLYYVALGASLAPGGKEMRLSDVISQLSLYKGKSSFIKLDPLFRDENEYSSFLERHRRATVPSRDPSRYKGRAYLGIDSGSTTIKCCILAENGDLLLSRYSPNNGNPVQAIASFLSSVYEEYPNIIIAASASTGYGEDLLKTAFSLDYSLVETQAHFIGAKHFMDDVDFIIDIGGQDIKCFRIRDGAIDDIFLNEACSSGCGSFLQTFANALGKSASEFARLAISAKNPVDLGSRCTVFMNSSVKQAQKDGASINDISAGLAISVVKNALYKVIRTSNPEELGRHIVVQGGTFLNDAVLRAFEKELGLEVVRPSIAGLMGAYGAALYARMKAKQDNLAISSTISDEEIANLNHTVRSTRCQGCENHCLLTINSFGAKRRMISGNKCERPLTGRDSKDMDRYNLYSYKQKLLSGYRDLPSSGTKGTIGLPLALGMYELLPFYATLFTELGYKVVVSPFSDRDLYIKGQSSIPSDTVCFPAKLMHGHVEYLVREKVDRIFIPCSSYNINEEKGNNHFNCPVVAYYGEVIKGNQDLGGIPLILGYLSLDNPRHLKKRVTEILGVKRKEASSAVDKAFTELYSYRRRIIDKGNEIIGLSRKEGRRIIVLAGRPYHADPEINHSIDRLIVNLSASVITEDSIAPLTGHHDVEVLNQWTYHARMYDAACFIAENSDMDLVQLVSFGCGLDAVTTDEVREILRKEGRIYTQLKIDEITNVGAVKIRLRSLFAALEMNNGKKV